MIEMEARLKHWGRSFGIIVPMSKIKEENLSEKEDLNVIITKKENPFLKAFGKVKRPKKSTEQILKEIEKEGWND